MVWALNGIQIITPRAHLWIGYISWTWLVGRINYNYNPYPILVYNCLLTYRIRSNTICPDFAWHVSEIEITSIMRASFIKYDGKVVTWLNPTHKAAIIINFKWFFIYLGEQMHHYRFIVISAWGLIIILSCTSHILTCHAGLNDRSLITGSYINIKRKNEHHHLKKY